MFALLQVIIKELLQLRHDRKMIPVLVVGPLVQLIALGFAANLDVNLIPMLVVDRDRTPESARLVERFTGSRYFNLVGTEETAEAIEPWLVENRAQVALVVGDGYGEAVAAGRRPTVQLIADGTDSNSAVVGMAYASRIVTTESARLAAAAIARGDGATGGIGGAVELVPRVFYNPDLLSRWFYVPAVLAMVLLLVTMILPSMAVVREKEIGTLEQISVTPLRPWQLVVGKLVPFAIIGIFDTLLITAAARAIFGVPLRGSLLLLVGLTTLYLLNTLGLGLLMSTIVRTQQQAMMGSSFALMVPMIYLSGLIFPIENMPRLFQLISYAIPVTYYANILRAVFLRGSGFDALWFDALMLAALGMLTLTLASMRFRKSLD
ncbi:MAG: ABC transporter permease [Acidobacteria bacterium]|nr:ABC transporter permease [Acidobacteriota bacterium]